jgi:hypothetical protein
MPGLVFFFFFFYPSSPYPSTFGFGWFVSESLGLKKTWRDRRLKGRMVPGFSGMGHVSCKRLRGRRGERGEEIGEQNITVEHTRQFEVSERGRRNNDERKEERKRKKVRRHDYVTHARAHRYIIHTHIDRWTTRITSRAIGLGMTVRTFSSLLPLGFCLLCIILLGLCGGLVSLSFFSGLTLPSS